MAAPSTIFGAASSDVFSHPDVAALSDGRFVIVAQDDTTSALVASIYDPVTHAVTPLLNSRELCGAGTNPHVAGVPGGGFVVSFDNSTGDVIEDRFGPGGSVLFNAGFTNSFTTGAQDQNAIAANASGTVFFAWQDAGSGNPNSTDTDTRIEAQAFHLQLLPQPNFNGDGNSDILWQNANGQAAIWEMNGTNVIGGGRWSAPIPARAGRRSEPATSTATACPTSCGRTRQRAGRDLGDERDQPDRRQPWSARQSRAELEGDRNRRLQRRRPFRHPVAEHRRARPRSGR